MRRLWLARLRWSLVVAVALLGMQSAWGGNGCRDTIRPQCQSLGWRYIRCCQILSNRYNFALCYCEQFQNSQGANYFSGVSLTLGQPVSSKTTLVVERKCGAAFSCRPIFVR
jgi:hypothetical protein